MSDLGNKAVLSGNLKYYMKKHGIDRQQICDVLNFKYSTFSDWINGNKYPRIDKIEVLANYFGIDKSDLIEKRDKPKSSKGVLIPVLGYVRAGLPIEAVQEILDYEEISREMASQGEHFGLRIIGDSMEPRIQEGDVVIVRKQPDVDSGQIAVVMVDGNDATVKKLVKHNNGISLVALNSKYSPSFFTNAEIRELPVTIIGKVVELRGKL